MDVTGMVLDYAIAVTDRLRSWDTSLQKGSIYALRDRVRIRCLKVQWWICSLVNISGFVFVAVIFPRIFFVSTFI